jgi:signal transduction histidine kinase
MRAEHSLHSRFFWAIGVIVALLVTSFAVALALFVHVLEEELLERVVRTELQEMPGNANADAGSVDNTPHAEGLRRWTVPATDPGGLPPPLRRMPEGVREITWNDGSNVFAGKLVTQGHIHAIVADIQDVERLEQRLLRIGVGTALAALLLSTLFAAWLSRTALRPISTLVESLGTLDPASPRPLLVADLQTGEARLIAEAVDRYQDRITRLLEREKSLTDDISHQLRTPASVITTASELIIDDPTVVGLARERVERIARAARRMASVVETLLFLGRDDSVNVPVAVDMRAVVNDTVELYLPVAHAKGIELSAECGSEQWVIAPPGTAAIVLQNLIENAIRFTDRGSVRVVIEPGRMTVEDTGIGLSGVDRDRIFERGYRGDASHGSGLGLDLVRRVCDRVGWQISARERPSGGTRFEVILTPRPLLDATGLTQI